MIAMTRKIVCPVDFSPGSERALAKAEALARPLDAELELLHVYELPALPRPDRRPAASTTSVSDLTDSAERALQSLAAGISARGVTVTTRLVEGDPAGSIAERAREVRAALIVMGTRGRSGLQRLLSRSTAERVVRTSTIPVMTVHLGD
jgi:nucleotide-binding universal stress UspA family protein